MALAASIQLSPASPIRITDWAIKYVKEREKGKSATLKDLDYRDERRVVSNPNVTDVKRAIAKDVAFMEKNRLIDYSMMLGLHYAEDGEPNAGTGGDQRGAPRGPSEAVPVPGMDVSPPPSPMTP